MAKVKKRVVLQKIREKAKPKVKTLLDDVQEKMLARADERRAQRRAKMTKPKHDEDDDEPKKPKTAPAYEPGDQYPEGDPKKTDVPETRPNPMGIPAPDPDPMGTPPEPGKVA